MSHTMAASVIRHGVQSCSTAKLDTIRFVDGGGRVAVEGHLCTHHAGICECDFSNWPISRRFILGDHIYWAASMTFFQNVEWPSSSDS